MNTIKYLFFALLTIGVLSCSDKEAGDVDGIILTVSPTAPGGVVYVKENTKIELQISISSGETLSKVKVTEIAENALTGEVIFEEAPNTTSFTGVVTFLSKTPPEGNSYYEYEIEATDSKGLKSKVSRKIFIQNIPLSSYESITLYSAISTEKLGGYSILDRKVITITNNNVAFIDATDTTANATFALSNEWIGKANTKFVRSNSYKYETATYESIQSTFEASNASDIIGNLAVNDIILVKYKNENSTDAYGAIKIVNIIDSPGADQDSYIFNLKIRK